MRLANFPESIIRPRPWKYALQVDYRVLRHCNSESVMIFLL